MKVLLFAFVLAFIAMAQSYPWVDPLSTVVDGGDILFRLKRGYRGYGGHGGGYGGGFGGGGFGGGYGPPRGFGGAGAFPGNFGAYPGGYAQPSFQAPIYNPYQASQSSAAASSSASSTGVGGASSTNAAASSSTSSQNVANPGNYGFYG